MDYKQLYQVIHEYTLALRAVCRTLDSPDAYKAYRKMSDAQRVQFLELARTGQVSSLRDLILTNLSTDDLTTMSYQRLRERASRLRICGFNKMNKSTLINHIQVTEEVLREKLKSLPKPKFKIGFEHGDGI